MPVPDISLQARSSRAGRAPRDAPVRGTQSLVGAIVLCWRRPRLLVLELAWRWGFGIPALALIFWLGWRLASRLPLDQIDYSSFTIRYPLAASQLVATAVGLVGPPVLHVARWLAPLLAVLWAIASGLGRNVVLKRMGKAMSAPEMRSAPGTLIWLQLLRIAALGVAVAGWWFGLRWGAQITLGGAEPNLIGYCAWAICLSLGVFALWAVLSWVFSIAPTIAVLEGDGVVSSLKRSFHLGSLASKLAEVNLTLGIVKVILVVLAFILSATPIPFTATMQGLPLYLWWMAVSAVYLAFSDFFQLTRLSVFIRLWEAYRPKVEIAAGERPVVSGY